MEVMGLPLRELCIHLTRQCNQSCLHCYYNADPKNNAYMPLNMAKEALIQASKSNVRRVTIQGGEPFLYKDLEELCALSKSLGLMVAIPTNGLLLDKSNIKWIKKYVDIIFVSIHGNEAYHDAFVRHKGAYSTAMSNIKECCIEGIKLGVLSTVTNENKMYMPELSSTFDKMGVLFHGIIYHSEVGRGSNIKSMDFKSWDNFKLEMKNVQKNLSSLKIRFESQRKVFDGASKCSCLGVEKYVCFLDTEGYIYPCSLGMNIDEFRYGHISENSIINYFKEISWDFAYSKSPLYDECSKCQKLNVCHGGCMVKRYLGDKIYCEDGKYMPICVLYPDIDVYEMLDGGEL